MMSEPIVQSAVDSALVAPSTGGEPDISALAVARTLEIVSPHSEWMPSPDWQGLRHRPSERLSSYGKTEAGSF